MLSQAYSSPSLNATVSYTYDAAGREQTMTAANQAQTAYSYDNANRLTGVTRGTLGVTITPDADGRRQTVTLPNGVTVTYTYDGNSNVSSITYKHSGTTLGTLTYGYDADGRVISMGGSLASVNLPAPMTATYDSKNQLAS
jgi:YD repeat-containing protein